MKITVILLIILGGGIACALVYLNKQKSPPPAPVAESASGQPTATAPEKPAAPKMDSPQQTPAVSVPAKAAAASSATVETKTDDAANSIHKAVDDLLSAKNGLDKHNL